LQEELIHVKLCCQMKQKKGRAAYKHTHRIEPSAVTVSMHLTFRFGRVTAKMKPTEDHWRAEWKHDMQ